MALETVWVDYLCPKCGRTENQRAGVTVYCPCGYSRKPAMKQITSTPIGELQVKARKGPNK